MGAIDATLRPGCQDRTVRCHSRPKTLGMTIWAGSELLCKSARSRSPKTRLDARRAAPFPCPEYVETDAPSCDGVAVNQRSEMASCGYLSILPCMGFEPRWDWPGGFLCAARDQQRRHRSHLRQSTTRSTAKPLMSLDAKSNLDLRDTRALPHSQISR